MRKTIVANSLKMKVSFLHLSLICFLSLLSFHSFSCSKINRSIIKGDFRVGITEYLNKKSKSIVIIVPPTGGENFIDRSYAKELCNEGISASILSSWTNSNEYSLEFEIHTRFYKRAQRAISTIIKEYENLYSISMLGTSVGGLHTAISCSRFKQILKCFTIVSGANIAEIIANTSQEVLVDGKKKRFKIYNINSDEAYLSKVKKAIPFEPLKLSPPKSKKLGMVLSKADTVVPSKNQLQLRQLWSPKKYIELNQSHTSSVIYTWLFKSHEVVNFFK
jgi:hypothetical protein